MAGRTDLDYLRIYADPGISPEEKVRLLGEEPDLELPPIDVAPPEGRLAQNLPPEALAAMQGNQRPPDRVVSDVQPRYQDVERGARTAPPEPYNPNPVNPEVSSDKLAQKDEADRQAFLSGQISKEEFDRRRADAPIVTTGDAAPEADATLVSDDGEPPQGAAPVGSAAYRAALDRGVLMRPAAGGRAVPQESVSEEMTRERGTFGPSERAAYIAATTEADILQQEADELRLQQEEAAGKVQLASLDAQNEEQRRFAGIQREELGKARRVRDRMNTISEEIASLPPAEEGLFVGKSFGESLLVGLGALAFGLGAGASGNSAQIMPTLQAMARREVDRQKRYVEQRQGAIDQLGTIYERHLANLQDEELASKATVADIMRSAERQMLELANSAGANEAKRSAAQAAAAQIQAARIQELAQIEAQFGDKVKEGVSRSYKRAIQTARDTAAARQAAPAPGAAAPVAQNPKPNVKDFASPDDYFRALADWQTREEQLEQQAVEALKNPKPKAKGGGAPAPAPGNKPQGGDTVLASMKTETGGRQDEFADIAELLRQGRPDAAIARMSPDVKAYYFKLYDQSLKNMGEKAETSDAAHDAFAKLLGERGPVDLVPRTERDRIVTDGTTTFFAPTDRRAQEAQKELNNASKALRLAREMKTLADKYKGSGYKSAEVRGTLLARGSELMALLSKMDEQGVIREGGDETRYQNRAGMAVQSFIQDPTTDPAAAIGETLRSVQAGRQMIVQGLSRSWRDFESAAPKARRREAAR